MREPPDLSGASWRLKLLRTEKHILEVEREIRRYGKTHPYEAFVRRHRKDKPGAQRAFLRITEQPNPMLGVIIGDALHNMRSALDHLIVSIAPRKRKWQVSSPIENRDLWAEDRKGAFVIKDNEARERFDKITKDLPPEVLTLVHWLQPYQRGDDAQSHPLSLLNRLDNADKHRQLVTVVPGLRNVRVTAWDDEEGAGVGQWSFDFREDGAEIMRFRMGLPGDPPSETEVRMEIRGFPQVAIRVGDEQMDALVGLREMTVYVWGTVLPKLEPFARVS